MNLERAFSRVRTQVEEMVPVPDPAEIVVRGRRRRLRRVIAAGLAVVALIVGGYSLAGLPMAASPEPATNASWIPPSGNRVETSGRVEAGFLVHEEEPGVRVSGSGGGLCLGEPAMLASSERTLGDKDSVVTITQTLYVYPDEAAAGVVMQTVRQRQLRDCLGFPGAPLLKNDAPPWGDEAVGQTVAKPADGAGDFTNAPVRMVMLRVGRAVAVFEGYPEIPEIDQDAQAIVERLCVYNTGCEPQAGEPRAVRAITNGGQVWVAALDSYREGDPAALPGAAIAAAAERGYLADVVPVDCDQGAAEALGISGAESRYVAVYFRTREEAEVLRPDRGVFAVRTWCVPGG